MTKSKNKKGKAIARDFVKVHGFFRLQITEDRNGKTVIVGDSGIKNGKLVDFGGGKGMRPNAVTNLGIQHYIVERLMGASGGTTVGYMALGTGTQPGVTDTTLNGENFHKSTNSTTNSRAAVSTSVVSSKTAQFTAAFSSANSFVTATANISNIGLFDSYLTSLANVGSILAGNTYSSSSVATNQNVNATYQIQFS